MALNYRMIRVAIVKLLAASAALAGCSTSMGSDGSGSRMSSGITEARNGAAKAQTGVDEVGAGSQSSGMAKIGSGMDMMNQGISDMHSGMNMMSSGMMAGCMDGGSPGMMNALQQAMDEMRAGQMMMSADASNSTADGISRMHTGISMMNGALDEAQASMGCMGHSSMMSGGMN